MITSGGRPWTPTLNKFTEDVFAPYVSLIGQVALAWNDLHERLALIFWAVMGGGFKDKPIGIWNSQGFDRARRQLLKAAVNGSSPRDLHPFPKLKIDVIDMVNELDNNLEQRRNDIVHSPLHAVPNYLGVITGVLEPVMSDSMLDNQRALNIWERDISKDFAWCRDTILLWRDFASGIERALTVEGATWPDRPSLPPRPPKRTQRLQQSQASRSKP